MKKIFVALTSFPFGFFPQVIFPGMELLNKSIFIMAYKYCQDGLSKT